MLRQRKQWRLESSALKLAARCSRACAALLQVANLKTLVDDFLKSHNVYDQIRGTVDEALRARRAGEGAPGGDIFEVIEERGIIDDILRSLDTAADVAGGDGAAAAAGGAGGAAKPRRDPQHRYLHVKLLGGRAFVDHIDVDAADASGADDCFVLHLHYRNQRFRSALVPCAVDPRFGDTFLVDLQPPGATGGGPIDVATLLRTGSPIHMVLCRVSNHAKDVAGAEPRPAGSADAAGLDEGGGGSLSVQLIAAHTLEWRRVLARGGQSVAVELTGVGAEARIQVPVGILDVRMELLPAPSEGGGVPLVDLTRQLKMEEATSKDALRQFFKYSHAWWREFREIHPSYRHRRVKIFAENERGESRPVCSFVTPLRAGRLLDSARHAARFVSLIPYERSEPVGGADALETWQSTHTLLAIRKGDTGDHAVLLASLLLGFCLDAYVVAGTKLDATGRETYHVWVMTRTGSSRDGGAVFWESLTGKCYPARSQTGKAPHRYCRIGCAFNHERFYANKQRNDMAEASSFDFANEALWKEMNPRLIAALPRPESVPLCPPVVNAARIADAIEVELRDLVAGHRKHLGLSTRWDDELAYLFTPALAAYENERLTGVAYGNEEFQQAIKRAVPEGHTFKGFPVLFGVLSPRLMMQTLTEAAVAKDIMGTRGDAVALAVRCRVFPYPEDTNAAWVMIGVKYRPVPAAIRV